MKGQGGRFEGIQAATFCTTPGNPCSGYPIADVVKVERKATNVPAILGGIIGLAAGLAIASGGEEEAVPLDEMGGAMMESALKVVGLGVAGGLVGYLAGYAIGGGERWQVVPLITPAGDGGSPVAGAAFRASFRLPWSETGARAPAAPPAR